MTPAQLKRIRLAAERANDRQALMNATEEEWNRLTSFWEPHLLAPPVIPGTKRWLRRSDMHRLPKVLWEQVVREDATRTAKTLWPDISKFLLEKYVEQDLALALKSRIHQQKTHTRILSRLTASMKYFGLNRHMTYPEMRAAMLAKLK